MRRFQVTKIKRKPIGSIADVCIMGVLILLAFTIILPFYNMLLISFSTFEDAAGRSFDLMPRSMTLENYRRIFSDAQILNAIWVSVRNVIFGTAKSMVMTILTAYALSRKNVPGRRLLFYFVIFTMFFSAGLIPWYMVMLNLGFVNNFWVMTVPNILSVFNMILMRNYFFSLPDSLEESARLDGAGEFIIMVRIIVPLSAPILATVALFYAVGFWNEWWNAMLFLQDPTLAPLALLLRRLVIENSIDFGDAMAAAAHRPVLVHDRALQLATVTVATVPILCVYPFLQKYFTKGIMLGAIKA